MMTDPYEPGCFGGAHPGDDNPIETCRFCGDDLTESEAGVCTRCYESRERRNRFAQAKNTREENQ